jgi:pantoate--beta-alanine ligase
MMPVTPAFNPHLITLIFCPTLREPDGLAKSSRNRRLTESQRAVAGTIYQCLVSIQAKYTETPFLKLKMECEALLLAKGFEPEYIALAHADTLEIMEAFTAGVPQVVLIAAWLGKVRLIDNMTL